MNMKRRNADCGKLRRPVKRSKITEGFYGSTFLYLKFLLVWILVLMADFILEFRFEYLWPFWLLLRSVYDSFKFQGLAFSIFFIVIALTSDMICYLFIPVHWLFFAASTYVWVQYVWHTERGICLPTVSLWLLFVYIEASVRLREIKSSAAAASAALNGSAAAPTTFNLDLCRPFAAHCIGYPVVTLGFGFKSYVGYRMRQRKQKEVAKENEFYMQLLQQALPSDAGGDAAEAASNASSSLPSSNGTLPGGSSLANGSTHPNNTAAAKSSSADQEPHPSSGRSSLWSFLWPSWGGWGSSASKSIPLDSDPPAHQSGGRTSSSTTNNNHNQANHHHPTAAANHNQLPKICHERNLR